ncbi:MAG: T9SS type A sorting domain-containing protein, partial [Ignavibacteriaceae bacterium]
GQNYPNPFNPTTQIKYALKEDGFVYIRVYDTLGKVVATLVNENKSAGFYTANFDASRLSSGIYFYTIKTNNFFDRKKMIVLK